MVVNASSDTIEVRYKVRKSLATVPPTLSKGQAGVAFKLERSGPSKRTMSRVKLYPIDEGSKDRSFEKFRKVLREAVRRRDKKFILGIIDPQIRLSLGGDRGLKDFNEYWRLESRSSKFWRQLTAILSLGATFEGAEGDKKFCEPYVTTWWKNLVKRHSEYANAYEYAVILRKNVKVRSRPSASASVLTMLSFDVVKLSQNNSGANRVGRGGSQWVKIKTFRGNEGYVKAEDIRSPIDYSACFKKTGGRWMMVSFIAGD